MLEKRRLKFLPSTLSHLCEKIKCVRIRREYIFFQVICQLVILGIIGNGDKMKGRFVVFLQCRGRVHFKKRNQMTKLSATFLSL